MSKTSGGVKERPRTPTSQANQHQAWLHGNSLLSFTVPAKSWTFGATQRILLRSKVAPTGTRIMKTFPHVNAGQDIEAKLAGEPTQVWFLESFSRIHKSCFWWFELLLFSESSPPKTRRRQDEKSQDLRISPSLSITGGAPGEKCGPSAELP